MSLSIADLDLISGSSPQLTPYYTDWLLSRLSTVTAGSNGEATPAKRGMLVHPLDGSTKDQEVLAQKLGLTLIQDATSIGDTNVAVTCSCWGGLDLAVQQDVFADEQTLGFLIESLVEAIDPLGGLCVFAFGLGAVYNCNDYAQALDSVLNWLTSFCVEDLVNLSDGEKGSFIICGKKRIAPFHPPLRIAAAFSERKLASLVTPLFMKHASLRNVELIADGTNGAVDIVVIKSGSDFSEFATKFPAWTERPMLDRPDRFQVLNDRMETNRIAESALTLVNGIKLPFATIDSSQVSVFPIVAKPNNSSMHADLWFIDGSEALAALPSINGGWFYQSCVSHRGDVVFKASVIGKHVSVARRPSAVSASDKTARKLVRTGDAHPRKKSKTNLEISTAGLARDLPSPTSQLILDVADALRLKLGLVLFGFDLLVEDKTHQVYLVDINYFPSFVDVPGRDHLLFNAIAEHLSEMSS